MASINEKLSYINDIKILLKKNINKINNVLTDNSTFRSYSQELFNGYLDILNNGTDTLWNNLEKVSASGEEITLENVEAAPMKIEISGNISQDGEPAPNNPQQIKVVKGENVVSVQGKNLLPFVTQDFTIKGVRFYCQGGDLYIDGTSTGEITTNSTAFKDNFKFTLKAGRYSVSTVKDTRVKYIKKYSDNSNLVFFGGNSWVGGFTLDVDTEVYLGIYVGSGYVNDNVKQNAMLRNYQDSSDYVPCSKTDYPINLGDIELCKINAYKDFPFKAINGNEYYDTLTEEQKNALNYGSWYVHKEIGKKIFDGSEGWNLQSINDYGIANFQRTAYIDDYVLGTPNLSFNNYFSPQISLIAVTQTIGYFLNTSRILYVRFESSVASTPTEFKNWLSNHNMILYYVLATPTEEEITNITLIEQLEAISKAKSVKDKTYITQTNDELPFIINANAILKNNN